MATIIGTSTSNTLTGTNNADTLFGLAGNDTLFGLAGNDRLDGGLGNDIMTGDLGNDTYVVDSIFDRPIESAGAGIDVVLASVTFTLGNNLENLTLTGAASINGFGNSLANVITGNGAANVLLALGGNDTMLGLAGNDHLDGGLGIDLMAGGIGNDTYVVDSIFDRAIEGAGAGIDVVRASVTFTLGNNLENLILIGAASINGFGNGLANVITGNNAANVLLALGGNDTMVGLAGNDHLDGGLGSDLMAGGIDNDIYIVDDASDIAAESLNAGTDLVRASVAFTLGNNVENLTLTGAAAINGTGNSLANVITGNNAANVLSGLVGNDALNGLGGNDRLDGGTGADAMAGGIGDDTYVVDDAGDTVSEAVGAGTDLIESSIDFNLATALEVENLTLLGAALNGTGNALANLITGNGGNNTLIGAAGNDQLFGGAGLDAFVWNPGDANDVIEGGTEVDTLTFNGSAGAEILVASANAARLSFTRNLGNIVMDVNDVETLALNALGGADSITVNALTGTDVTTVNIDLGVGAIGDGAADTVTVAGTAAADVIQAVPVAGTVQVNGLTGQVNISHQEAASDRLVVNGLGGNDTLSGGALASVMQLTLDGGIGNDTINGGNGADTLLGGDGNDTVDGNGGNDTFFLGNGNDTAVWDPGDGSDIVEGQEGTDTLQFNGAAGPEIFAASSNGGRLFFTRNVGNIVMDTDDVEILTLNALGSADTITINDLAATDLTVVSINLGVAGFGDGAVDALTINGTTGNDIIGISGSSGNVTITVNGAYVIAITNAESANDTLTINLSGGNDTVDARGLASTSIRLTVNGGAGDDFLLGSAGNDTLNGDADDDYVFGSDGADTMSGGAGTADIGDGGSGIDTGVLFESVFNIP
jgi:Ca2+-binding RTX toxin-like protein